MGGREEGRLGRAENDWDLVLFRLSSMRLGGAVIDNNPVGGAEGGLGEGEGANTCSRFCNWVGALWNKLTGWQLQVNGHPVAPQGRLTASFDTSHERSSSGRGEKALIEGRPADVNSGKGDIKKPCEGGDLDNESDEAESGLDLT